jgi:hypothetical protein
VIDTSKKYKYANGQEAIILTDKCPRIDAPIVSMTTNGDLYRHDENGKGFVGAAWDIVPVNKYDHLEKGDLVEIKISSRGEKAIRVFEGINIYGKIIVSSYTGEQRTYAVDNCRLLVKKEHIVKESECGV